jgi:photosystem II stability/assembly factor-like uncharacterized protein
MRADGFKVWVMKTVIAAVAALAVLGGEPSRAAAGVNRWSTRGPEGGRISGLAIDPTAPATLYAASGSLFKTQNAGGRWRAINTGLINRFARVVAVDPGTPTRVYAGTSGNGLFKSVDAGETWAQSDVGLTSSDITAVLVDPVTPTIVYAGTFGDGVFKSVDAGGHWSAINTGLNASETRDIRALALQPDRPQLVYAATRLGVFQTFDSGDHWLQASFGLTNLDVHSLAIDPVPCGARSSRA